MDFGTQKMTAVSGGLFKIYPELFWWFLALFLGFSIASSDAHQTTLAPMERDIVFTTQIARETDTTPAVNPV